MPIHLAKGTSDKFLFNVALLATLLAILNIGHAVYTLLIKY